MKLLSKFVCTLLAVAGAASVSLGQTAPPAEPVATPPPLPPGPLLQPVPDLTQWTIVHKAASGGQGAEPQDEKAQNSGEKDKSGKAPDPTKLASSTIVGQRTGNIRHILITYGNGGKMEFWIVSGTQFVMCTGWKSPVVSAASDDDLYGDFAWISASNFQGIKKVGDKDYMIFRDSILPPGTRKIQHAEAINLPKGFTEAPVAAIDPESLKVKAVASIELERRLPVGLQIGKDVTAYKFDTLPPGSMLAPPPDVEAAMGSETKVVQSTVRKSVRP